MLIAERKFVIDATRERIWDLLLRATLRLMPFERMNIRSQTAFSAILRMKISFITLPMEVDIEIVDIVPSESLSTILRAKGLGGVAWLNQRSAFKLTPVDESRTEIDAEIFSEGMSSLLRVVFMPKVKKIARDSFKSLEERLKQWA